jgi:hypothetical protein
MQKIKKTRKYFLALSRNEHDTEINEISDFLKENESSIFPYEFTKKYSINILNALFDNSSKMCFA